ncbi:hypothetical protein B0181_06985 [Moraxella caviae]|uniref:Uncharacterized protein n=1 Tax=Moraxella caviae TaxID=34060 RepID=A0A1T0A163_9GAMM|nr:hypothetical protein B0181_06985 [Moraxella caviae]
MAMIYQRQICHCQTCYYNKNRHKNHTNRQAKFKHFKALVKDLRFHGRIYRFGVAKPAKCATLKHAQSGLFVRLRYFMILCRTPNDNLASV